MKSFTLVATLVILANVSCLVQGRLNGEAAVDQVASEAQEQSRHRHLTELTFKGQNGVPASAFPLGLCQGSCRGDYDCSNNLKCYTTSSSSTSVPGCSGSAKAGVSYCVSSSSNPTAPAPTPPAQSPSSLKRFRLRLYWQKDYTWGGKKTGEQRLCMQCVSKPCKQHDILTLQTCSSSSAVFRFLSPTPVKNTVQIRIVGTSLCLEKTGTRAIKAENCRSGTYPKQFWFGGDDLSKSKFELVPDGFSSLCVAADGTLDDPIYAQNCADKRKINVTNWSPF